MQNRLPICNFRTEKFLSIAFLRPSVYIKHIISSSKSTHAPSQPANANFAQWLPDYIFDLLLISYFGVLGTYVLKERRNEKSSNAQIYLQKRFFVEISPSLKYVSPKMDLKYLFMLLISNFAHILPAINLSRIINSLSHMCTLSLR